ncbi:hypothetical protein SAMN05421869_109152 [Nonomuraea jiangxiensis]|uniref:Uncharacterized protein n=1 Tax=Nonomuraea jiangxiensis TaxID=633440 RepID=A0A1G8RQN4_9ACTN|nr:hypothetical protein SAMN05421869_109152 [Nonomuraea jiangxiensis]
MVSYVFAKGDLHVLFGACGGGGAARNDGEPMYGGTLAYLEYQGPVARSGRASRSTMRILPMNDDCPDSWRRRCSRGRL